jgi:hypothetical protein
MGRPRKYLTEEERREALNAQRREWYAANREKYILQQRTREQKKKEQDQNYKDNNERNREYYNKHIKPMRMMATALKQSGISVVHST